MSVYRNYCHEITDEYGNLKKLTLDYPDNFNFGYDVVDKTAQETPNKRARMVQRGRGRARLHFCGY